MLTIRCPWGATTVLLCALLLQNCQSQLNALEEESPAAPPPQSGWQPPASEALTRPLGYPPPLTTATHQSKVPPAAFAGSSPSTDLRPAASTTRSRNIFTQDSYRPFTASTGELVRFQQVGSQWQAVVQGKDCSYTRQRTLPVVSAGDIGTQLTGLREQDVCASRSRIHIMAIPHPPYSPCVYLGKSGLLGGMPTQQAPLAAAARANAARDVAVAKANTERDAAVAKANEAGEALGARDQEIAQASNVPAAAFGAAEWKQYFGNVGSAPALPSDMAAILDGPCPFWPGNLVKDTHLLVLVPATVDGKPFTLDLLGKLIKSPKEGDNKTECSVYGDYVSKELGARSPRSSYWALMTRDVLPNSRCKTYNAQKELVAAHASRLGLSYEMPHALAAATAILLHHVRTGERLYIDAPWTFTRCQEKVNENRCPVVVGGFSSGGLRVHDFPASILHDYGVSCLRKF